MKMNCEKCGRYIKLIQTAHQSTVAGYNWLCGKCDTETKDKQWYEGIKLLLKGGDGPIATLYYWRNYFLLSEETRKMLNTIRLTPPEGGHNDA